MPIPDMTAEDKRLFEEHEDVILKLDAYTALTVLAALQLALRHPQMSPAPHRPANAAAQRAHQFALGLQEYIGEISPRWAQVADAGWHPEHDE